MEVFKTHAYEVQPQRLAKEKKEPRGGAFSADKEFRDELATYLEDSKLATQPIIDFKLKRPSRNSRTHPDHEVRSLVLDFCYAAPSNAKKAAVTLARRLANSMDDRSRFLLLMLVAYKDPSNLDTRQLVLWAFPKDEPFQFTASSGRARLKVPKDIFSRSSKFKKGALFTGENVPSGFLRGRVIDKQAGLGSAADFWVDNFLGCKSSLNGEMGTRILVNLLKDTYHELQDRDAKDNVSDSVVALHASQRTRWSLNMFANEYLTGSAKKTFLRKAPHEVKGSQFTIQKAEFERKLNFRVFQLEDGVKVSAPFGTIGDSVKLTDKNDGKRHLKVAGDVAGERFRAG